MAAEKTETEKKNTVLGDFELLKKLGQGGMGVVYLGHQVSLDRTCAVKVLSKEMAAKPGFVERFVREARSMAKIDHPNVVTCYAVGEAKGHHFVAMELMDGKSMQDWLNALKQIPVPDAMLVTIVCGEALHFAHEKNMIHRDVKPDNILVTKKGIIKVSDLGLAKAIDDEDMALTQSGTGLGTPHYMAPEQARNAKHVDRRCDVYALGCTLYHFVSGKTPFAGGSIVELITNKEKGQFTPAHRLNSAVPERLSLMIDKAMAKDPKSRYQTCGEFVSDLEALGLAGEALSFIDEGQRTVVRRHSGGGPGSRTSSGATMRTMPANVPPPPASATPKQSSAAAQPGTEEGQWFVKHQNSQGHAQIAKMSTGQLLNRLKTDKLNEKAQASLKAQGPFLPLFQIPVFESEAKKMLMRQKADARDTSLASQYQRLARQHDRRKIWRFLARMVGGIVDYARLIVWLVIIAVVGIGLYLYMPILYRMLAKQLGLDSPE